MWVSGKVSNFFVKTQRIKLIIKLLIGIYMVIYFKKNYVVFGKDSNLF